MKYLLVVVAVVCCSLVTLGQPLLLPSDSLRAQLVTCSDGDQRMSLLTRLARECIEADPLASIRYAQQALQLARQHHNQLAEAKAIIMLGWGFAFAGNFPLALQTLLQGLHQVEVLDDQVCLADVSNALGYVYSEQGNYQTALTYYFQAHNIAKTMRYHRLGAVIPGNIGLVYRRARRLDLALAYARRGQELSQVVHNQVSEVGDLALLGDIYADCGDLARARLAYRSSIRRAQQPLIPRAQCGAYLGLARLQQTHQQPDSALYNAQQALFSSRQGHYLKGVLDASEMLSHFYATRHDSSRAYRYLTLAATTRDSLFSQARVIQVQSIHLGEQLRHQETLHQQAQTAAMQRQYLILSLLIGLGPVVVLLWHNNRLKRRSNWLLSKRNKHIARQRDELRTTLQELQDTQSQLVAAEKWAFVGELSAGIAHELQNPLHFMKKFAEVSSQLIDGLPAPAPVHGQKPALEQEILIGLRQNLQEISQHGLRASAIIQDMLVHARSGHSQRTPTDLRVLADECLALAYRTSHDKHAPTLVKLTTQYAPDVAPVPVMASDLSRALLNLFTNAFYAVQQRQALAPADYQPEVSVWVQSFAEHMEIRVRDNGIGIPAEVGTQIFQPFFTTKPLGEGSGLGLSLSYDIITKGHGGTLQVESREHEFTEFRITLPA